MNKRPGEELLDAPAKRLAVGNGQVPGLLSDLLKPPEALNCPRLWYKEGKPLRELAVNFKAGVPMVEVGIPAESMTSNNKQVKARQLWGDGMYTDDSDVVAVLMHLGYYAMHNPPQASQVSSFHALLRLLPPQDQYASCFRNSVRSRAWHARVDGCSYQVERCWLVTRMHKHVVALSPSGDDSVAPIPTFAPAGGDRHISTRSSGRPKVVSEVTVLYNLANEPWMKYAMAAVADAGLPRRAWTSARLRSGEVLYLESNTDRYEICYTGTTGEGAQQRDTFALSRLKQALPLALMRQRGIPSPPDNVAELLEQGLAWDDLHWGTVNVKVRSREIRVVRLQFLQQGKPADGC